MRHARPSKALTRLVNKTAITKKFFLLPLLTAIALAGVVFSGSSVHSSDTVGVEALQQQQQNGASTAASGAARPGSTARDNSLPLRAGSESARAENEERAELNHSRVAAKFFPSMPLVAPSITATKVDALVNDDGDGKIDPTNGTGTAEKITYTVTITNTGSDATHLKFTDTIDTHTTLVAGSLNTQPIANDDTYSAVGNVRIQVPVASGVLVNDLDPDGTTLTSITAFDATSANGGTVTMTTSGANAGAFTYDPPPGFEGTGANADTFTYTVSDGTATATATVKIDVSGMVWFINASAAVDGDGRLTKPFKFLSSFQAINNGVDNVPSHSFHPAANDNIFLYESATSYDGPLTLLNGQKLIGQDSSASLSSLTGITPPTFSDPFPTGNTAASVNISSASNAITLGSGNLLRGFGMSSISGTAIQGTSFGTLSLFEVNVASGGTALSLTTGTLSGPSSVAVFGALGSGGGTNGVLLSGVAGAMTASSGTLTGTASGPTFAVIGGTVSVTYSGNITQAANNAAVSISGGHATGTITFNTGTISATNGTGLQFSNADGTYNFSGTTTLNGVDAGIDITAAVSGPAPLGSAGTFNFSSGTAITNPTNEVILITGGTQNVTYSGSFTKNGTRGILIQNNTGGTILFDGASATETKSLTSTGATNAIDLLSNGGTTINFTNNNLVLNASGSGVGLNATGGGTITVQGTGNTITSNTGTALNVVSTNIGLSGLTFQSINAGTAASGPTSGIVLNSTGTTAGTNGGLTVTGTSTTAGTGGTIQKTGQGAVFTSTINLTLKNMNFTNANSGNGALANVDAPSFNSSAQAAINMDTVTTVNFDNLSVTNTTAAGSQIGINGRTVSGLTINNTTVSKFGDAALENDMKFFNLTGTCSITNSTFSFAADHVVDIRNNTGTLTLNVKGNPLGTNFNTFSDTQTSATGAAGLSVTAVSSATINMTVMSSKFLKLKTVGIQTFARDTSTMNVDIVGGGVNANGNQFDPQGGIGRGVDLDAEDTAHLNFNVNNNPRIWANGGSAINIFGINDAQIQGRINNNPDIQQGGVGTSGTGINVHPEDNSDGIFEINGNTISNIGLDLGIWAKSSGSANGVNGTMDVTIKNNHVTVAGTSTVGIQVQAAANAGDQNKTCANVGGANGTAAGGAGSNTVSVDPTSGRYVVRNGSSNANSRVYLEGFTTDVPTTWASKGNTPTTQVFEINGAGALNAIAPPVGQYPGGLCKTVTYPTAMLDLESDPNNALAQSGSAYASLIRPSASLVADYVPANDPFVFAQSEGVARAALASADAINQAQAVKASLVAVAPMSEQAMALNNEQSGLRSLAKASVNKNRREMQLSHAIVTRSRTRALAAAALMSGETITVDGGAAVSPANSGFTLPSGKSVTITFQVTLNNTPNLVTPIPAGGAVVSNQGTVTADSIASVLTDDTAVGGSADPTTTPVDLFNSQTSVITSLTPSSQGENVTFTATVSFNPAGSPSGAPGTPTGTVDFFDGAAIPANAIAGCSAKPVDGSGVATCTTSAIPPAGSPHTITARYNGDGNFETSSGTVQQTVNACTLNPIVTSTGDSGPNTLRDALANVCTAPNNNITFNLGAGSHTITALSTLVIAKNANITNTIGAGNGPLTITANGGNFNVFRVDSPVTSASISNLTVTGANATSVSGGGLLAQSGTVTLTGMLFTGNTVINGDGGGVTAGSSSTVNILNSTISGNTARNGGGLFSSGGTLNLLNVTVTNNNANGDTGSGACPAVGSVSGTGGGLRNPNNDTNATNSIIAGNTACSSAADASGAFATLNSSFIGGDRRLAALADNGGATRTHALLSDSPALDAGDNCVFDGTCAAPFNGITLTTDQRGTGFARKRDAADADTTQTVDIGAFEADPSVENISNKTTAEDTALEYIFNVGDSATAFDSITTSSSNTTLLPNASAVVSADTASTRKLTLTPVANEVGTTTITVTVTKTISGTTLSMSDTFDLTVTEVNDAPTASADTLLAVNEDSPTRIIPFSDLTTNDSKGPANENGQTLTITAVSNPVGGTVQINGTNVEFTLTANFAGAASFDYTVTDNGTTNGANDFKSANGSASFTVTAINDEPSFTKGADETVAEDAGAQTVNPWATGISRGGGADENGQTLTFNITNNTNTALFSVQPAVSDTGVLTYTPAANAFGTAAITLELMDNGGTLGGGDDTSPTQTFNITVTPVADTPSVTNASTTVNVQTTSGLVIDHNAADSGEVTHFKITNIQNGTLFQTNGSTPINDGDFITYAEGNAGLKFTPATGSTATGSFDVQAATDGSGSGLSGAATATITVTKNGTSTDVTSSSNPSYNNQTVTFTATVTSNTSLTGPPTGTVDFLEGATVICNDVALDGAGKATCQTNTLTSAGSPYNITAVYSGDSVFDTSTSSGLSQQVQPNLSLTVNMTSDAADANVGDGVCDTDLGTAGDQCTLRAAIQETNSAASDDIIDFNIPTSDPGYDSGTGVYTITLSTALADINGNLTVNGLGSGVLTVKRSTAGGTPDFRIFRIDSGTTVMIFGMTIANGKVSGVGAAGGGIENVGGLTLDDMVITGNNAPSGGGINNFAGSTLTAGEITVSNNTTTFNGGGISNTGTMNLTESTISGNTAGATAPAGGIYNALGTATITNTTVSGNSAGDHGGGIYIENGSLTAVNVTITNNSADSDNNGSGTGGGIYRNGGTVILHNTIVAGNFNENGAVDARDDVNGPLDSSGVNNLIGDGTGMTGLTNGSNGNQVGTMASPIDPRLGPLAANGGLTKTHALLPGSPALDAGSDTEANNAVLVTDQRCSTHNRYVDSDDADTTPTVDIGAFEAQVAVQDIADQTINEDAVNFNFNFNVSDGLSSANVTTTSSDTTLLPNANISVTGASSPLTLTLSPAADQFGTTTITVTVTSGGETMTDTFLLTVNAVNDVPSFTKGADQTVGEDAGPQSVPGWATGISAGPANENTQTLSFEVTGNTNTALFSTQPAVSSTGTLTYTPASNANGTATITLVIKDSGGTANSGVDTSGSQTFDINVTAVNDVPTADAQSVTTAEDTPKSITLSGSDAETPSGSLTFSIGTGPANGMLSGTGANRTYTPNADYNGPDSFTFKVNDGTTDSALATVTINVTEVNDAPAAVNDTISNVAEDSAQRSIPFSDLTGNDSKGPANENGQTLTVNNVSNAVGGTVSISGSNVLFTPTANFNGAASFQYTVQDNGTTNGVAAPLTSAAATVSFNITPTPDTPSVTPASTNEDTQSTSGLVITRNAGDGPEVLNFKITGITGGSLFQNNGTTPINNGDFITVAQGAAGLKFTPTANSNANGSFNVQASLSASDAGLGGGTATATITINPINDAPTLDAIGDLTINEDAPLQTVNLAGISTGGGETQTLVITATSSNTGLIPNPTVTYTSPNATGSLSFTPVLDQSGSALITVTVNDGGGTANGGVQTVVRTFTVTVNPINDAPVNLVPGPQATNTNTSLTFSAANGNLISIMDVDAGAALVQVTLTATHGTLSLALTSGLVFTVGDGTADATMTFVGSPAIINSALNGLVFTPTAGFNGGAGVDITTNDQGNTGGGSIGSDTDSVAITVSDQGFHFSAATYSVGEADGHATITVAREGSTASTASISYVTSDLAGLNNCDINTGDASARCDYTAVGGTLNFLAGQSSLTFTVPVINDVYVEGPEVLTLTLSNPAGAVLGATTVATLTITDDDLAPGATNPIGTNEFLIRQLYLDFLNREPEPSGLAAWLNRLNTCPQPGETIQNCDKIEVASAFFRSPESFDRGYFIYSFYEATLGRQPQYAEYQNDLRRLTGFLTTAELEQRKREFVEEFINRAEFKNRYDSQPNGQPLVDAILATAGEARPGVAAAVIVTANRQSVINRLNSSAITRSQGVRELVESPEISQRFYNKAFVVVGYFAFLRRNPDAMYLSWIDMLNTTGNYRDMIRGFLMSAEYRFRFGPA